MLAATFKTRSSLAWPHQRQACPRHSATVACPKVSRLPPWTDSILRFSQERGRALDTPFLPSRNRSATSLLRKEKIHSRAAQPRLYQKHRAENKG